MRYEVNAVMLTNAPPSEALCVALQILKLVCAVLKVATLCTQTFARSSIVLHSWQCCAKQPASSQTSSIGSSARNYKQAPEIPSVPPAKAHAKSQLDSLVVCDQLAIGTSSFN